MNVEHIVIFRLGSLGDTVVSLPCWHRLMAQYPDARRTLLTNMSVSAKAAGVPAVLDGAGFIDDIVAYPIGLRSIPSLFRLFVRLRRLGAKTLIYLAEPRGGTVAVYRDLLFFRLCGFRKVVGLPLRREVRENLIDPHTGREEQECLRLTRQMDALGPFELDDRKSWDLRLSAAEMAEGGQMTAGFEAAPFIAVNMGGKDAEKDWGEANWEDLIRALGAKLPHIGLLTVGAPSDAGRAERLLAAWPGPTANACGRLSVRACAAALAKARLFIGHDSGPLHLAAAQDVPCVGLYGDFNRPNKWHPYGIRHRIIHEMAGLSQLSVEHVLATAMSAWEEERGELLASA